MNIEEELVELVEHELNNTDNIALNPICESELENTSVYTWLWWVTGFLTTFTALLGIIANILSLVVLCRKSMRSVFNHLLVGLCVADLVFLVSNLMAAPLALSSPAALLPFFGTIHPVTDCCCHVAMATGVFITISITMERHQAVCSSHLYQSRLISTGHRTLLAYYIVPSILCSILLNIPRFIAFSPLGLELQKFTSYIKFIISFQVIHPFTSTGIVPFLVLIILNYRIYRRMIITVNHSRRNKDFIKAKIVMIIVGIFLLLNLPRLVIGLFEVSQIQTVLDCFDSVGGYRAPVVQDIIDIVARYLSVLNSSLNFFIYCLVGSSFRTALFKLLKFKSVNEAHDEHQRSESTSVTVSNSRRRAQSRVGGFDSQISRVSSGRISVNSSRQVSCLSVLNVPAHSESGPTNVMDTYL